MEKEAEFYPIVCMLAKAVRVLSAETLEDTEFVIYPGGSKDTPVLVPGGERNLDQKILVNMFVFSFTKYILTSEKILNSKNSVLQ